MTHAEQQTLVHTLVDEIVRIRTRYSDTYGLRREIALEQLQLLAEKLADASIPLPTPRGVRVKVEGA